MNFLLDLLLLVIVTVTVIRCTARGFVKSIVHLVSMAVAFIAAWSFSSELALWLEEKVFSDRITESVAGTIRSLAAKGGEIFDLSRLFADMPADFVSILDRYGADADTLAASYGQMSAAGAAAADEMAYTIAEPVVHGLANVCAFVLIFVGAMLVCWLVGLVLDLIVRLPVLRTANRFFGFLLGVVCAAVLGWLFAEAAESVVGYLHTVDPAAFDADIIEHTKLVKYLCCTELWQG